MHCRWLPNFLILCSIALALFITFASEKVSAAPPKSVAKIQAVEGTPFYTVQASLGEYGNVRFLIDTGASETVLADWIIRDRKIPVEREMAADSTDARLLKANVKTMKIGKRNKTLNWLYVVPTPDLFRKLGIGGILNPQKFFHNQDLLIDFPQLQIVTGRLHKQLARQRTLINRSALSTCSSKIDMRHLIEARADGVRGRFYINTGGAQTALRAEFADRLPSLGLELRPDSVPMRATRDRIESIPLRIGQAKAKLTVGVETDGIACPEADGKIGTDVLKDYAVYFSANRDEFRLYR